MPSPSSDFEVLPVGTITEMRLSRAVANAIDQAMRENPQSVPESVRQAYAPLRQHYAACIEAEQMG